jgi:hypothetical protein
LAPGLKASKAKGASQHYLKQKCNYVGSVYTTHAFLRFAKAPLPKG